MAVTVSAGGKRTRPPLQHAAVERCGTLRRCSGDRLHQIQGTNAKYDDNRPLLTYGYIPELHSRL